MEKLQLILIELQRAQATVDRLAHRVKELEDRVSLIRQFPA
jgi:hypothetical protein